ncbi:hypothetical protein MNB_SV-12-1817 [hydrothermal vent metagenome]|uniref:Uncharacterized protein n=1 Tax=hydrothermal vent metagenome TaxID=652676 RepID=A0A1W1B9V7_9ZZZZ
MKLYIKMVLTFLLLTGLLYSKSTTIKPISVKLIKSDSFFDKNQRVYKRASLAFLVKPVSFSSDLSLNFEKVFFLPKK